MREVLKKLLRVGLVVAVLLAPVAISGTVMEGEVWALGKSRCQSYAQKGAEEGKKHGTEDGKAGNGEGWRSTMSFDNFGENVRQDIEECYMYCGEWSDTCDGYEQAYDKAYDKAYVETWESEEGDGDLEDDEPGNSSGGTSGGNSSGGNSSGGNSSGGNSSGGNSSGGGSSGGSGGGAYEPGIGSGMDGNTSTNILPDGWKIDDILRFIMNVLMYGLGAAATIGVVVAGIQYLTARDNEQQVVAAKRRLFNVVLGLAAWAMLYTLLHWLIPGFNDDLLNGGKDESGMVEESEIAKETGFSL